MVQETTPLDKYIHDPDTLEKAENHLNMQTWQGMILMLGNENGTPRNNPEPRAIGFLCSLVKSATDFIIIGENNPDGVLHYHIMLKTLQRSDALKNSIERKWHLFQHVALDDIEDPNPTIEILKSQKAHKPASLLAYITKNPLFVCAAKESSLILSSSIWYYNKGKRFLDKQLEKQKRKQNLNLDLIQQGHSITRDILSIIFQYNCKNTEDIFRANPDIIVQHLHRPGFTQIVKNCLLFVESTKQEWTMLSNKTMYSSNPTVIHTCFSHQGLDIDETDLIFYKWITKQDMKKNTILLLGPSNTGKSAFISGLKQVMETGEICNGQIFCFEGLTGGKKIGIWEEPLISPESAEKAKQVLEGMKTTVPAKYKKPQELDRIPIIITSNHVPWRYCTAEENAFRNRMWILNWSNNSDNVDFVPRSSSTSCECDCCTGCSSCQIPSIVRTTGILQGGEQPIQSMGRGDKHGCDMGDRCTRSVSPTMDSSDTGSSSLTTSGETTSWNDNIFDSSSSSEFDQQRTDGSRLSISSSTSTSNESGSSGNNRPSNTQLGIHHTRGRNGMQLESIQHRRSDVTDNRRNGDESDQTNSSNNRDSKYNRIQYANKQQMVVMGPGEKSGNIIQSKKQEMGGTVVTLTVPNKTDWCCYFSYLQTIFGTE